MDKNVKQKLQLSKKCNKTLLQIVTENRYYNKQQLSLRQLGIKGIPIAIIMMDY